MLPLWFARHGESPGDPLPVRAWNELLGTHMDAPGNPSLPQGRNSPGLGRHRLGCAGDSPGLPTLTTAVGSSQGSVPAAQHHFSWHSPSRAQCQRSQQPSQVVAVGFAPSREQEASFPPNGSLQSPALSSEHSGLHLHKQGLFLNLDPSLLCKGGEKVWAVTVFFRDQKSKKDENNLRWALDSFSPNSWGTGTITPDGSRSQSSPRLGSCSSTPKGFLPAGAHGGTLYSPLLSPCPQTHSWGH